MKRPTGGGRTIRDRSRSRLFPFAMACVGSLVLMSASAVAGSSPTAVPSAKVGRAGWDVIVYGATPAGISAAIAAARESRSVALLEPTRHIGGMMTGGLGVSDIGSTNTIGGIALDLFRRLGAAYRLGGQSISWDMTPGVAERTFSRMLSDAHVSVFLGERLRERSGVAVSNGSISRIFMQSGGQFAGRVFIDATYEGDLTAQAGVSFTVGREPWSKYSESLAGVQQPQAELPRMNATSSGGTPAPGVDRAVVGTVGSADTRIQPYNFRLCVTADSANQVPFPRPDGYDPARYLLVERHLQALEAAKRTPVLTNVVTIRPLPGGKADLNAAGPLSTDLLGASDRYPNATYAQRQAIWEEHYRYQAGLLYFLAHDPAVPTGVGAELRRWGLCRDEFTATRSWPSQLYVREARRMVSEFVLTQPDLMDQREKQDAIGVASYRIDGHAVRLISDAQSTLEYEGALSSPIGGPYDIPYRILVPRRSEIVNLLDPVTVSASHVAFASLRMEPQYMIMGEAAGSAAALAVKSNTAVQDVNIGALQSLLRAHGAVVRIGPPKSHATSIAPGAGASTTASAGVGVSAWYIGLLVAVLACCLGAALVVWRRGLPS